MSLSQEEIKFRKEHFEMVERLGERLLKKIDLKIKEIKEVKEEKNSKITDLKIRSEKDKIKEEVIDTLGISASEIKNAIVDLNEYTQHEDKDDFNKKIHDLHLTVFKELRNALKTELEVYVGDTELSISKFFERFYSYLSYIKLSKNDDLCKLFNKEYKFDLNKLSESIDSQDFFNRRLDDTIYGLSGKINDFLRSKDHNIPNGYAASLVLLNELRNVSGEHTPDCIKKDYLYDIPDYGNFYILSHFIIILIYAYLEILERWNKLLY